MPSFHDVLQRRLRHDPGQPLVTFYDDASGERTELSVTTYANWVAKTAGVLTEDLDLDAGDALRLDLPTHWLGPVFLGAALTVGVALSEEARSVVGHGPDATLYCALLPFAVAAREPVPSGALDFGTLWPGQPDAFLGIADATPLEVTPDDRRLLDEQFDVGSFLSLLLGGGSLVLVAHPDPTLRARRLETERAQPARS